MSRESLTRVVVLALVAAAFAVDRTAYGVDPQPLQDAYYRFEEAWVTNDPPVAPAPSNPSPPYAGQGSYPGSFQPAVADSNVVAFPPNTFEYQETSPGVYEQTTTQVTIKNTVKDSINANHMGAYNTDTAPKYVNYNLPPTNLASGEPNTMAWEVDGSPSGGRDVYTDSRPIQNGVIGGMYNHDGSTTYDDDANPVTPEVPTPPIPSTTTGFTLEAAFSVFDNSSFRAIVAKEGRPGLAMGSGDQNLPTLALKVRGADFEGDPDQGKLQIELFDGAGNLKTIMTDDAMALGSWYYAAVVNDGETMSLYLDRNDGEGYELVGSEQVTGALFQGTNFNNADWNHNWTIGRAVYGGASNNTGGLPSDFFNGLIDEVRLTNEALDPSEFLFAQEDGDFNDDGSVDGADFLEWQRGNSTNGLTAGDLQTWKDTFGSATVAGAPVPEPATLAMAGLAIGGALAVRRRRR